ncbi:MAG: glycosyltransferase family 39 protein [Gemmataceae bacterium]|nr:glycosyltransferase family 39 protein [Gemmataceae bacterium]
MAAAVGGRIEAVERPRSVFAPDYLRLAVLVLVAAAVHGWLVAHTAVTARDGLGFARYAICLQSPFVIDPHWDYNRTQYDVVKGQQHPPGYPAAVWLTAKLVRAAADRPHPEAYLLSAQLVSAAAAVLLVVPVYFTGRMLFGRSAGFAAALLISVLPTPARLTSDALTEGMYLLAAMTAVTLGVRAVRRPGVGGFLLCGLAVGATYLVRPEGLMVAGAVGAVAGWLGLTRKWPRDLAAGRVTALVVGVALVATPYMVMIGKLTNKPSPQHLLDPSPDPRARLFNGGPTSDARPVVGGPILASWWNAETDAGRNRYLWGAVTAAGEAVKALHYLPAGFALLGLVLLRRRVSAEPGAWVLLALAGLNFAVLIHLAARTGYVSERHTVLLVTVGCLFAGAALEPVAAALASLPKVGRFWAGKLAPAGLLVMLVATALPATLRPLHANREGHKHVGRKLAELAAEHEARGEPITVVDPFCWAEWYSGRSLYYVPQDQPAATVRYVVLDDRTRPEDHTRLPRLDVARDLAAAGTVIYHWPEDVPVEQAKVKLYKFVGPSELEMKAKK